MDALTHGVKDVQAKMSAPLSASRYIFYDLKGKNTMIRVLVLYPRGENNRFDQAYYLNKHLPLGKEKLSPLSLEADIGVPRGDTPSPYFAVTHMIFDSKEELSQKYAKYGKELNEDKNRFTDIDLIFQISEITKFK